MAITQHPRPTWYSDEDDTAWTRIKAAFQRDWQQTKHDFGSDEPDLDQDLGDTVSQAIGDSPIPPENVKTPPHANAVSDDYLEDDEPAYRYGYAASRHYQDREWCPETEAILKSDWGDQTDWQRHSNAVRRGWTYGRTHPVS